jgi:hypothetical protein
MEQENLSPRSRRLGEVSPAASGRTASGGRREWQSTEAGHRGGRARSSGEGPVMGLERRGRADQGQPVANPSGKEPRARPRPEVKPFEIDNRLIAGAARRSAADPRELPGLYRAKPWPDGSAHHSAGRNCRQVTPGVPQIVRPAQQRGGRLGGGERNLAGLLPDLPPGGRLDGVAVLAWTAPS